MRRREQLLIIGPFFGTHRSRSCFWARGISQAACVFRLAMWGEMAGFETKGEQRSLGSLQSVVGCKPALGRSRTRGKAARRHGLLNVISQRLFAAFPRAFKYPPVPLAIGIGPKLCELMRPEFKPAEIRAFLYAWTSGPRYLKAVARGEVRRNLDGSRAGVPEPKDRAAAQQQLQAIAHSGARSPSKGTVRLRG
jgi:hypothetical protein